MNSGAASADDSHRRRYQRLHFGFDVWRTACSVLDLVLLQAVQLVTSPALLDELDEKLRLKFEVAPGDADAIRTKLENCALVVTPASSSRLSVTIPTIIVS